MKRLAAAQYPRLPLSDNCQTIVGLRLPLLTFLWNSVRWCWTCLKAKNPHRTVTLVIVNVFIIKCSVDNTMCQQTRETRVECWLYQNQNCFIEDFNLFQLQTQTEPRWEVRLWCDLTEQGELSDNSRDTPRDNPRDEMKGTNGQVQTVSIIDTISQLATNQGDRAKITQVSTGPSKTTRISTSSTSSSPSKAGFSSLSVSSGTF